MHAVDVVTLVYVAFSAVRGKRRGLALESYGLLRWVVALATGTGLYGWISNLLQHLFALGGNASSALGFVGTVASAWALLRFVKRRMTEWVASRWAPYAAVGGAVAGGLRAFVVLVSLMGVFHLARPTADRAAAADASWMARIASYVLPAR